MRIGDDRDAHGARLGEQRQAVAPSSSSPASRPAIAPTTAATPSMANAPVRFPTLNRGWESAPVAAPAASLAITSAGSIGLVPPADGADRFGASCLSRALGSAGVGFGWSS